MGWHNEELSNGPAKLRQIFQRAHAYKQMNGLAGLMQSDEEKKN